MMSSPREHKDLNSSLSRNVLVRPIFFNEAIQNEKGEYAFVGDSINAKKATGGQSKKTGWREDEQGNMSR